MTFNATDLLSNSDSSRATSSIVNRFSVNGYTTIAIASIDAKTTLSGALTANTLATILNITGTSGQMSALAVAAGDATSRTIRVKVTVDGTSVYDFTSAATTTASNGVSIVGFNTNATVSGGATQMTASTPIKFRSSLKIEIASSLSETDKLTTSYKYNTEA